MRTLLVCVIVAMLAVPAGASALRPAAARAPTAVGVAQREFHMTPYRRTVPVGNVKLNLRNFGEDVHNVVVRGPRRFTAIGPDVEPGTSATFVVRLRRPGTYQLLCTRANHLKLGMKTTIKVVKPKTKRR
jgi:plastocyanin